MTFLFAFMRATHFAALMTAFGGNAYLVLIGKLPDPWPRASRLRILFGIAAIIALLTALVALCLTAGQMSGDWHAAYNPNAIVSVVMTTFYGRIFLIRVFVLAGLVLSSVLARRPLAPLNTMLAGVALAMLGLTSHAAASGTGSSLMAANDALHLLCAGFWIGGLSVLGLIVVERKPGLSSALRVFSRWGFYAVLLLTIAGTINALVILRGSFASLSRIYLTVLAVKIILAAIMISLALANRLWLTPAVRAGDADPTEALRWSIASELGIGVVIVFLASLLGLLPYSMPA